MVVTTKHLEAFICVADLASLVRTGERLSTTQPIIGNRISILKGLRGAPLFDRTGANVHLTPKGATAYEPSLAAQAASSAVKVATDFTKTNR